MARPKKQGLEYFSHDTDAVNDEKVEAIRALYGNDGYAFYFILLERIYRSNTAELDISKFTVKVALISKLGIGKEKFESILDSAFEIGLFNREIYNERSCITSDGIQKRCAEVEKLRQKWRDKKGKKAVLPAENEDNDVVFQGENEQETQGKIPQRKVKESKVNESKELKPKIPSPRPKKSYAEDSPYYKLALYFFSKLKENAEALNIGHVLAKTNLQSWADDFRKMVELKKYPEPEIRKLIDWVTNDTFWRKNVLSAGTLMEKYPSLVIKMASEELEVQKNQRKGNSYNNRNSGKRPLPTVTNNGQTQAMRTKEEYRAMLNRACEAERKPLLTDAEFESKWSQYQERRSQAG